MQFSSECSNPKLVSLSNINDAWVQLPGIEIQNMVHLLVITTNCKTFLQYANEVILFRITFTVTFTCQSCFTFETGSNTAIGHVWINKKPFCGCHTKSIKSKEITMHCQADHLNFSLELYLSSNGIAIFKPLDCYNSSILENPFVDDTKPTFS